MKIFLYVILQVCYVLSTQAQSSNHCIDTSIKISGRVKWKSPTITGFPDQVKVTSSQDTTIAIVNVDSFGRYVATLLPGSYTIAPAKEYHFMNDRFIRIDDNNDKIVINLSSAKEVILPTLELDTIVQPGGIPERGILFDFDYKKAKILDEFVKKQMAFYQIPGASLALVRKGKVVYHQVYGVKNSITNEPVTESTLFEAGSITKPVFAFVVMRLVEKGILDLDKPLYRYLAFKDVEHDERYQFITARHVLSHQTGFPNWAQRNAKGQFDLKFTPGTAFGYSGEAYEYLKRVVEHISHKEIEQILKEELLIPLNWKSVYFRGSKHVALFEANGHIDNSPTEIRLINKPQMSYSMIVEARSFTTFMLALRNKTGLKSGTYNELLKIHATKEAGVNWSLGFCIENSPFGLVYRHGGSTGPGFICNFSYFKDLDMGFVMFTNSHMGEWLCIPLLTEFLITGKKAT